MYLEMKLLAQPGPANLGKPLGLVFCLDEGQASCEIEELDAY